jgi:hypothetical protein
MFQTLIIGTISVSGPQEVSNIGIKNSDILEFRTTGNIPNNITVSNTYMVDLDRLTGAIDLDFTDNKIYEEIIDFINPSYRNCYIKGNCFNYCGADFTNVIFEGNTVGPGLLTNTSVVNT